MAFCEHCGTRFDSDAVNFCANCGTKRSNIASTFDTINTANTKSTSQSASTSDWVTKYSTGRARAIDAAGLEEWIYDRGTVKCTEGPYRGRRYEWDGKNFQPVEEMDGSAALPRGEFDSSNGTLKWFVPYRPSFSGSGSSSGSASSGRSGEEILLHEYVFNEDTGELKNVKGVARVEPVKFTAYVHWQATGDIRRGGSSVQLSVAPGQESDHKEGSSTSWDLSNFPLPVGLFVAMYTRAEKMIEEAEERAKRVYSHCGKLVLTSTGIPMLCGLCAEGGGTARCVVCDGDLNQSGKHEGQTCKACGAKRAFCWKCGDRLNAYGTPQQGFVCSAHAFGVGGKNCCKTTFTVPRTAQY